jgi:hypothetical protein
VLTTARSQTILHVDALYNIKRKKYKTVCAELAFAKVTFTEWSCFFIQLMSILTVRVPPFDQTIFEYWNNPTA